jgi:quercetin dioxygenase-like cupin family protein
MERRSFLGATMAAFPLSMLGQSSETATQPKLTRVPAGEDRFGEHHAIGVSSTDFKVATKDANGGLFIMEHTSRKKGGPPRHLHHNEDEWLYAIEGDYIVEVGSERFRLKSGDSILGPGEVPHAWAFVADTPGKLRIAFAPANEMEEFFRSSKARAYSTWDDPNDKERFRTFGLELVGPPISRVSIIQYP